VQGVAEGQQASQLAEAALLELKHLRQGLASPEDAAHDESSACAIVAGVDALLRCSLRGQQPWPNAVLSVSRALLQQQGQWAEQGYRSSAGGSPVKAHAVLLLFNSQLAALAGMRRARLLLLHVLLCQVWSQHGCSRTCPGHHVCYTATHKGRFSLLVPVY